MNEPTTDQEVEVARGDFRSRAAEAFTRFRGTSPALIYGIVFGFIGIIAAIVIVTMFLKANAHTDDAAVKTGAVIVPAGQTLRSTGTPIELPSPSATATPTPSPRFPLGSVLPPCPTPDAVYSNGSTPQPCLRVKTPIRTALPAPTPTPVPQSTTTYTPYTNAHLAQTSGEPTPLPAPTEASARLAFGGDGTDVPAINPGADATAGAAQGRPVSGPAPGERNVARAQLASTGAAAAPAPANFYTSARDAGAPTQVPAATPAPEATYGYTRPHTRCTIALGTFITVRIKQKIVSDLPGPFLADIIEPVYNAGSHTEVCAPTGTHVFSNYQSGLEGGQNRLFAAGATFVLADGREFSLGALPYTDAQGAAGLTGDTDPHRGATYTAAFVLTAVAGIEAAVAPQQQASIVSQPSSGTAARSAAGGQLTNVAGQLVTKNIARPPTIIIRPPDIVQMMVTHDLPMEPYYQTTSPTP